VLVVVAIIRVLPSADTDGAHKATTSRINPQIIDVLLIIFIASS
jgi:hypothetical protein